MGKLSDLEVNSSGEIQKTQLSWKPVEKCILSRHRVHFFLIILNLQNQLKSTVHLGNQSLNAKHWFLHLW